MSPRAMEGRPPAMATKFSVRLDASLRHAIEQAAASLDLSPAAFVRLALARAVGETAAMAGYAEAKREAFGVVMKNVQTALRDA